MAMLTTKTAEEYVRDYFAQIDPSAEVNILDSAPWRDGASDVIDVRFDLNGGRNIFSVWAAGNSLRGEW
jgi:hypothetical protein